MGEGGGEGYAGLVGRGSEERPSGTEVKGHVGEEVVIDRVVHEQFIGNVDAVQPANAIDRQQVSRRVGEERGVEGERRHRSKSTAPRARRTLSRVRVKSEEKRSDTNSDTEMGTQ